MLLAYAWPGNIRELRNVIERAVLLASGDVIEPQHLPGEKLRAARGAAAPPPDPAAELPPLEDQVRELEIQQLREALRRAGGVKKHAAALLGIPLRTFHTKLRRYGLA
jgi:DNA-binding NtrC family response regulator